MNTEAIKIDNHIKTVFNYINVEIKLNTKTIGYKIFSHKGFEYSGKYDISIVANLLSDYDRKIAVCKKWFFENITNNLAVIETLVNGHYTYYHRFNITNTKLEISKKSDFSIRFGHQSDFLTSEGDTYVFEGEELNELFSAVLNLGEKLHINGYPLSMLRDEYSSDFKNLLDISYKNKPEVYELVYMPNELGNEAIKNYPNAKSESTKNFWRKILEKDYMLKKDNNPLHKERENELKLFYYDVDGEAYKSDGYDTWKSDIEHKFISDKELDLDKLKDLYEREYDYEVRDFLYLNVSVSDYDYIPNNNCTFIEVDEVDGRYITRPANYRFRTLKY